MKDIWTSKKHVVEKKTRYIPYQIYSNCVTEIPQNIKLTLENNVATVKSGSIVVLSGSTYTTATLTQDETFTISNTTADGTYVLYFFYTGQFSWKNLVINSVTLFSSGSTDSLAGTGQHIWFDTTNRIIKRYNNDESSYVESTYTLAIINVTSGVATFAKDSNGNDMIFNGAGFIGHHAFVLPNVKALIPDGFNEDGSLKSILWDKQQLFIKELETNVSNYTLCLQETYPYINYSNNSYWRYSKEQNKYIHNQNSILFTGLADYSVDSNNVVTDFTIHQPYEGATEQTLYNEEEYDVEYNRTFLNIGETDVFKAKNILQTQEGSLSYAPDLGIDLKRFLDPDIKIQNETFEAYSIQKLGEQGINTVNLISNEETFKEVFDYTVAETTKEGMVAK